jgi:chaperonin GroES
LYAACHGAATDDCGVYRGTKEGEEIMAQTATVTKLRPLGDRVVVRPEARAEATKSGILLPDTSKERPQRGEVIAVGDGRLTDEGQRIAMTLAAGDMVLFAKYGGTEFKLEDDELLILSEKDILAIVSE